MKIEAKNIISSLQTSIKEKVLYWEEKKVKPKLVVILATDDPAAHSYAKSKGKTATALGIDYEIVVMDETLTQENIISKIELLNIDSNVHGILVEFPLRKGLNPDLIQNHIKPEKDVDGLTATNLGKLTMGQEEFAITPATPQACIELLSSYTSLSGKLVAIIGRGRTVGRPLVEMLINRNATVTICHSKTPDIKNVIKNCEIVFVAIGRGNFVTHNYLSNNQIVVDVGINYLDNKLVGDVNPEIYDELKAYTTVPGGVGSLTNTIIYKNLLKAIEIQKDGN